MMMGGNDTEKYLICEDSLEGILSGIYQAYARKEDHEHLHIQIGEEDNLRLFAEYIRIVPNAEQAVKVSRTISRDFGEEVYYHMCIALASEDNQKGESVYKAVVYGLQSKNRKKAMDNLANPNIHKMFELSRNAGNEIHHLKEFLRFQELNNGMLFAKVGPKNNVVPFLAPHFADRLPLYNFIIYDDHRGIYVVHPASKDWYLVTDSDIHMEVEDIYSEKEEYYQELFTYFCHKIAIEERRNLKLQKNMLPLRFQEYMVEFRK